MSQSVDVNVYENTIYLLLCNWFAIYLLHKLHIVQYSFTPTKKNCNFTKYATLCIAIIRDFCYL